LILLAVGTQLPFDRLVRAVDDWARETGREDVVAQVGATAYRPHTLKAFSFLSPEAFQALQAEAILHISHAGMGSILQAMEHGKPIVIMPRDFSAGEHRNDHQMATARRFAGKPGVHVAMDREELWRLLSDVGGLSGGAPISSFAPATTTDALRRLILSD
jgi:UDP-N-acetylglucosamine transferase subunit ALG13